MAKQQGKTKPQDRGKSEQQRGEIRRFNVLSPYNYENRDGEEKTAWTDVGIAFPSKDGEGMNLEIRPGLSVSGRLVLRPWHRKDERDDEGPKRYVHGATSDEGLI